ncbi:glycosyltransferase family 2 protein [Paenibacillus chartarius]|uniref:Glycosyltransferase family 2 protein n=1 Tax=Paenibacillus chartarius TaxID=747481 RepID=A0ABV6DKQ9_9BACL
MDLSILVVNYNTRELTLQALRSVYASKTSYSYEVILIDNASRDDSVEKIAAEFPQVVLIANTENVGFARANNQGMRIAKGRYVLLLNSDTEIQTDTLQIMLDFMENHPKVGASGCKVILPDGSLDKACKRGFPTPSASFYYAFGFSKLFPKVPKFNQYQLGYLSPDEEYPVDVLVGAFMLVRAETIRQVGMMDEDFWMYGDDIDWCYRFKRAGWEVYYYPRTTILHHKRASWRSKPTKMIYEFHRAMYMFHKKHYWKKYPTIVNWAVVAGIAVKFSFEWLKARLL